MLTTIHNHNNSSSNLRIETDRTDDQYKAAVFGLALLVHNSEDVIIHTGVNGDTLVIGNQTYYPDASILAGAAFAAPYAPDVVIDNVTASASELSFQWTVGETSAHHRCVGGDLSGLLAQVAIPFSILGDGFSRSGAIASYTLDGSSLSIRWADSLEWISLGDEPPVPPERLERILEALDAIGQRTVAIQGVIDSAVESHASDKSDILNSLSLQGNDIVARQQTILGHLADIKQLLENQTPPNQKEILLKIEQLKVEILKSRKVDTALNIGGIAVPLLLGGSHD